MKRRRLAELHKNPASRGRVLRYIGSEIEQVAELVVDKHLDAIRVFKREREAAGKLGKRAHPASIEGVPKRQKAVRPRSRSPQHPPIAPAREIPQVVDIDPQELRHAAQDQIRTTLEANAASPELTGKKPGPFKITLSDGTTVERK